MLLGAPAATRRGFTVTGAPIVGGEMAVKTKHPASLLQSKGAGHPTVPPFILPARNRRDSFGTSSRKEYAYRLYRDGPGGVYWRRRSGRSIHGLGAHSARCSGCRIAPTPALCDPAGERTLPRQRRDFHHFSTTRDSGQPACTLVGRVVASRDANAKLARDAASTSSGPWREEAVLRGEECRRGSCRYVNLLVNVKRVLLHRPRRNS